MEDFIKMLKDRMSDIDSEETFRTNSVDYQVS